MLKHKGTYAFVKKDTKDPAHAGYTEINTILEFRDNKVNILLNCRFICESAEKFDFVELLFSF